MSDVLRSDDRSAPGAATGAATVGPAPARTVAASPPYLAGLNPAQREAVEALDGPVLVLAGAGTGKTRVLTTRLAHLLNTRRAWPGQILAVTFTNKAAREMRERVAALIGQPVEGWWLGTFHALAARILRRHAELIGLKPNFTILDTDDQLRLVKQLLEAENVDAKRWPARLLLGVIERWKDRGLTAERLKTEDAGDIAGGRMLALYRAYQQRLATVNACDFGDLLLHNLTLLQTQPDVLAQYHKRFKYILVDEYQDTNVAQYLWLRLLAQGHRNLCCVGDDDQSIYGWRGAEVGNILRFESDFPGARVIRLEQNYRSTPPILAAASGLIAHNRGRLGKTLFTRAEGGEPVVIRQVWDGEDEARWIGDEIEALHRRGSALAQVAVLVRAGFQMRAFEERFLTLGLPYQVVGGPRFYERMEIRDALAYLRVVAQPDDGLAFERIVNTPKRGIGAATVQTLHRVARAGGVSLTEAAWRVVETDELKPRARATLRTLMMDFERWRDMAARVRHTDLARTVLDESGYTAMWQADRSAEAPGRLENLKELVAGMEAFETLAGFLEHVSLVMDTDADPGGDRLTLMTLHAAKGLEFDHVFLPGWEEGLFPHQRAMDDTGIAGLEEERRLAYVGLTRARRRAWISCAMNRLVYGQWTSSIPSRFLDELPAAHVDVAAEGGLAGAGPQGGAGLGGAGPGGAGPGGAGPGDAGAGGTSWSSGTGAAGAFAVAAPSLAGVAEPRPARPFVPPRERRHRGGPPPTLEGEAFAAPPRPAPDRPYRPGERVFHDKFGYGTVTASDAGKLTVDFEHSGEKKIMAGFVQPAPKT